MSIRMQEMIDVCTKIKLKELEFKEKERQMGDRLLVSGTQVGMVIGALRSVKEVLHEIFPKKTLTEITINKVGSVRQSVELIEKEMIEVLEKQSIGHSENELKDDINDLANLFASWCSKTGE